MDQSIEQFILDIIDNGKDMTIATVRPDGHPQATTVSYANDGMIIYVGVGKDSQKIHNIRHDNRISLTINADYTDWNQIKGLSMGGTAEILDDLEQIRHAAECMVRRFPELQQWAGQTTHDEVAFLKIRPTVVSVLDYQKGFGHTELVTP